eukprot:757297-Hanusia_phi.AAC.1
MFAWLPDLILRHLNAVDGTTCAHDCTMSCSHASTEVAAAASPLLLYELRSKGSISLHPKTSTLLPPILVRTLITPISCDMYPSKSSRYYPLPLLSGPHRAATGDEGSLSS